MNLNFDNKTVVVTGAASGIGRSLALGFAQAGAKVIASDIDLEKLRDLKKEVGSAGLDIEICKVDVSNEQDVASLFSATPKDAGIDVLVHCAGITYTKMLTETSREEYRKLIETNLSGTFYCLQAASAHMKETGNGGSIIVISSINAHWPLASQAVYTATKAAIESMAQSLAVEVAPLNIRVNCIAPGAIDTPLNKGLVGEKRIALNKRIPVGRIGTPNDLVGAALFLASPAAEYVTGSTLIIDGGLIISR